MAGPTSDVRSLSLFDGLKKRQNGVTIIANLRRRFRLINRPHTSYGNHFLGGSKGRDARKLRPSKTFRGHYVTTPFAYFTVTEYIGMGAFQGGAGSKFVNIYIVSYLFFNNFTIFIYKPYHNINIISKKKNFFVLNDYEISNKFIDILFQIYDK